MKTRRSLAWLLYLSDDGWDCPSGSGSGGNLRAYPRRDSVGKCGVHEGNLQVGWLERGRGSEAVFLDSWVVPEWMKGRTLSDLREHLAEEHEDEGDLWLALYSRVQPSYRLYIVDAEGRRENISEVHATPSRDESGDYATAPISLREMMPEELRSGFSSTVCGAHPKQQQVQVSPQGGTLVIFDSSVVPHEATLVVAGQRLALFGFFAEEKLVPAAWVEQEGTESPCGAWFHEGWAHLDDELDIYDLVRVEEDS